MVLGMWMWSKQLAEVQTEHQNGEEVVVVAKWAGLSITETFTHNPL